MASESEPLVPRGKAEEEANAQGCFGRWREGATCWKERCCEEASSTSRDAFWDNWKGGAQCCVVSLHVLGIAAMLSARRGIPMEFMDSVAGRVMHGFNSFVLLLTMPSFCFISGYLSTATPGRKQIANLVRYSLTFLIFHTLTFAAGAMGQYTMVERAWVAEHPHINRTNAELEAQGKPPLTPPGYLPLPFFQTVGVDWYLWCVIIWRCFLPLFALLHRPLLVACLSAFFMMFTDAFISSYSITPFCFLPFFIAGFLFKDLAREHKEWLQAWRSNVVARSSFVAILAAIVVATVYTFDAYIQILKPMMCLYGGQLAYRTMFFDDPEQYRAMNYTALMADPVLYPVDTWCQSFHGVVSVAMLYGVSFVLIGLSMSVVPVDEVRILTKAGKNSIYIYFMHVYLAVIPVIGVAFTLSSKGVVLPPWLSVVLMFVAVLAFWVCLAQQWLRCFCQPCIEPDVEACCLARENVPETVGTSK